MCPDDFKKKKKKNKVRKCFCYSNNTFPIVFFLFELPSLTELLTTLSRLVDTIDNADKQPLRFRQISRMSKEGLQRGHRWLAGSRLAFRETALMHIFRLPVTWQTAKATVLANQ